MLLDRAGRHQAIPAFARAYNVPCSTCHDQIPRRNAFGEAFRKAGHRWPGDPSTEAAARKSAPVAMKGTAFARNGAAGTASARHRSHDERVPHDRSLRARAHHPGRPRRFASSRAALSQSMRRSLAAGASERAARTSYILELVRLGGPELNVKAGRFEQSTTMFKSNEAMIAPFPLASTRG